MKSENFDLKKNAKISQNIEKNCEKVVETLCNLPKTLQSIPADGLERFWDIMGTKNIFYLHINLFSQNKSFLATL